ncbi:unnamed protein product [Rotaria socialis]|uniref:HTH psq-type domain-containing protein n=2 Tax=Rotaria socialis TaxID=392032 RepID=A0A817RBU5_9BILA|nr:unnamed protein product [Rotaria socialis]CAF4203238.1 unnamed protein product [Rotaria socialis]
MTKKRRVTYSLDDFRNAISAYRSKSMTSVDASKKFDVPESTIRKHKNNAKNYVGSGHPSLLSIDQEQYLVILLKELESIGIRLTKTTLSKIAGDFIRAVNKQNSDNISDPSRHWFFNFFKRNADKIKMKKEIKLEKVRLNGFTEEVRVGWFNKLKNIFDINNLHVRPAQIWNCDESGFSDETQCEYVCVPAETKFAFEQSGGSGKAFTTILLCTSASGDVIPPFVIYAAKAVNSLWCSGGAPGTTYKCSESGWISEGLFTEWFKSCFLERTKHIDRPLLLVMDSHPTHINIDVIELAIKNKVILLCLPPHSTHALQPLDVVTLSSAKKFWKKIVSKYFSRSNRKTIRKIDFPSLLKYLMEEAFTKRQCVSGFARCGLWPFDGDVMKEKVAKKDHPSKFSSSTSINALENVSNNVVSETSVQTSIDPPRNINALQTSKSIDATLHMDNGNNLSVSNIEFSQESEKVTHQAVTNTGPRSMPASTKTMALYSLDDPVSIFNYPLTTASSTTWDENTCSVWTDTDGVWSSRITARIIMPVEDNEGYGLNSPDNKRTLTNPDYPTNKFMKYNNDFKSLNSSDEIYQLHGEPEKTFHELTSVPIEIPPFSPTSAVRSIVTSCLQEIQPPPPTPVVNKRVRAERRYGEEITSGSLLQELKDKKAVKVAKAAKVKRPRGAPKKTKTSTDATDSDSLPQLL